MIFPIPMSMGGPMDPPPSEAALKMRPIFWVVIGLQMLGGIARFIFLDIWGGIMSFFLAGIGSYAVKSNMELTWICCYGLCSFMNGLVDLVRFCFLRSDAILIFYENFENMNRVEVWNNVIKQAVFHPI